MRLGLLLIIFVSTFAAAQTSPPCGPPHVRFTVETAPAGSDAPSSQGKALLYVLQDQRGLYTSTFAIDGQWVGADRGRSWFVVAVDPGERHACVVKNPGHTSAFHSLSLEAGKGYFFNIELDTVGLGIRTTLMLRELDRDDALARMKKSRQVRATFTASH